MTTGVGASIELHADAMAVGGEAVGRDQSGRVVFVPGALAGETVRVEITSEHKRFARADLVEVIDASPDRIAPTCPHVAEGCGGCGFAHLHLQAQRHAKVAMVVEALSRIGGLDDVDVQLGPDLDGVGFRTTVRAAVIDGRAGYRRARDDGRLAVDSCRVAHPLVEGLLVDGFYARADEVTLRVGARTGERMARVAPDTNGVVLPDDVLVVGVDELAKGKRAWIHEEIAGARLRISADSFFQSRPDGAEALVAAVGDALVGAPADAPMADLYCGVGLFAATVGAGRPVVAVERSRSSVADAQVNLADSGAKIVRSAVERWRPSPATVVVADPPRSGLGRHGVAAVNATNASHLALVSCDAGSLGRDAGLLTAAGWTLRWTRLLDLFADTPHVEVVTSFTR